MKKITKLTALLLACLMLMGICCGCAEKQEPSVSEADVEETVEVPELEGYKLLWNDEFTGTELNQDIWSYEPHAPGWTNNELQQYTTSTDNVFLRDGNLVIKAIKTEADGKTSYTSGKITTQNKKDFLYGKVVARAKAPEGQGLWPAIWMMPTNEGLYGSWPKCGEIDIMEVLGHQVDTAYTTLHYGDPHTEQQEKYVLESGSYADSFHEYSVEWEPGEIRFYIDNNLIMTANDWFSAVEGEEEKPYPAPFDQNFYVQLNLAVGGSWPGDPDETTDFDNAEFEIDYVRVYQKEEYDTNVTKPAKQFREAQEDGNMIYNGDFSAAEDFSDNTDWIFMAMEGGAGSAEIRDNMLVITTENEGTATHSLQLTQPGLAMYKGDRYRVTFEARAEEKRDMYFCISTAGEGWTRYLPDQKIQLTKDWKTYTYEFNMTEEDDNNGRIEFNMGNRGSTAEINIRNVRVENLSRAA